jgi:hypothetical protein
MPDKPPRESYEPPRILRVKLVADEIAVTNCKSTQVAPGVLVCRNGGVFTNKTIGS